MAFLGDKNVGDIVKIKENGAAANFIIVQKDKPSSLYDSSCDGIWLLREKAHSTRALDTDSNDYENSDVAQWLNGEYLNSIDSKIRTAIKQVKIPFKKGTGSASTGVQNGANGLSCKIFLLSGYEVGFTTSNNQSFPIDGARLSYFLNGIDTSASAKRICNNNAGSAVEWWLRSAKINDGASEWNIDKTGNYHTYTANTSLWIRPIFILPPSCLVDSSGNVSVNASPTITSDKTGNLGTLADGFTCNYSVNDVDSADSLTVTLSIDSTTIKSFTATKGAQYTYSLTGTDWLKISNGSHTFTISATDGKETVTSTATFTRTCNKLSTSLSAPFTADDRIRACSLKVEGSIPENAVCTYEVTNNANDSSPVWEDCTESVKNEKSYIFTNKIAENGFAFNFRVTIQRGSTNSGGYITKISGGFE